jgi:poly(3-hydroxybutyrate) depolymerase
VHTEFGDSYCDVHETCEGGSEVGLCTLVGMDHCWPGGEPPRVLCEAFVGTYSVDINANDYMWEFFSRHPMP